MELAGGAIAHITQNSLVVGVGGVGDFDEIAETNRAVLVVTPPRQFDDLIGRKGGSLRQRVPVKILPAGELFDAG